MALKTHTLQAPEGAVGFSHNGISYDIEDGFVYDVPEDAVAVAQSHGFKAVQIATKAPGGKTLDVAAMTRPEMQAYCKKNEIKMPPPPCTNDMLRALVLQHFTAQPAADKPAA